MFKTVSGLRADKCELGGGEEEQKDIGIGVLHILLIVETWDPAGLVGDPVNQSTIRRLTRKLFGIHAPIPSQIVINFAVHGTYTMMSPIGFLVSR